MNPRDRKRHEQRKSRQAAAAGRAWGSEPELRNTRMLVLPLDDGPQVRRIEIDTTEPLEVVVRWGRRALLEAAPPECIRVVSVSNWNEDERELLDIPEARAYARRLWVEGKPLLRLLSESMWSPIADDCYGLPTQISSAFGLGWLDVYILGFCRMVDRELEASELGPAYAVTVEGLNDEKRATLRRELLEVSDENPGGVGFDAASERAQFARAHAPTLAKLVDELARAERFDVVLLAVSMLDELGRELVVGVAGHEEGRRHLERCRPDDVHPGAVFAVPRIMAVDGLRPFAPQASRTLEEQLPRGEFWTVTMAAGGTQVGKMRTPEAPL